MEHILSGRDGMRSGNFYFHDGNEFLHSERNVNSEHVDCKAWSYLNT